MGFNLGETMSGTIVKAIYTYKVHISATGKYLLMGKDKLIPANTNIQITSIEKTTSNRECGFADGWGWIKMEEFENALSKTVTEPTIPTEPIAPIKPTKPIIFPTKPTIPTKPIIPITPTIPTIPTTTITPIVPITPSFNIQSLIIPAVLIAGAGALVIFVVLPKFKKRR